MMTAVLRVFMVLFVMVSMPSGANSTIRVKRFSQMYSAMGKSISLTCPVVQSAKVQPALWHFITFMSMIKLKPDGITVEQYGSRFIIYNLTARSRGMYMCRYGKGQRARTIANVYVVKSPKHPPIPSVSPKRVIITDLTKATTLTCVAKGDKIHSVVWYKDGLPVANHNQSVTKVFQATPQVTWTSVLRLRNITKQDNGKYECRVFNRGFTQGFWPASSVVMVTDSACLQLNGRFPDPSNKAGYINCSQGVGSPKNCSQGLLWNDAKKKCQPPVPKLHWLKVSPMRTHVDKDPGQSVTIDCRLSSPNVEVELYQVDNRRKRRIPDGCKVTHSNQIFTIHALVLLDLGKYYCEAKNVEAKEELLLNVRPGPGFLLGQGFFNLIVARESSVDLECKPSIVPGSEISIQLSTFKSIVTLIPDGKKIIKKGNTFTIHGVGRDMAGDVFCKTLSSCGFGQAEGYKIGRLVSALLPKDLTPIPTIKPSTKTILDGDITVQFQCSVVPVAAKTITWSVDGNRIYGSEVKVSSDGKHSNLTLSRKHCQQHVCHIECRVTSIGVGYWYATAELRNPGRKLGIGKPQTKYIDAYKSASVGCPAQSTPMYQKRTNGERIPRYPDGIKIKSNGQSFEIQWFDNNDVGEYYCSNDDIIPKSMLFIKHLAPSLLPLGNWVKIAAPNVRTIESNGGTNLVCYTNSLSSSLTWTKTDSKGTKTKVTGSNTTNVGSEALSILKLRNASKLDEGTYWCSLTTGGQVYTTSVKVKVKDVAVPTVFAKPKIISNESQQVNLSCRVNGSPVPTVVWLKGSQHLADCKPFYGSILCSKASSEYGVSHSNGRHILTIRNISYESNNGKYECIASNNAGKATASMVVTVYVKPKLQKTSYDIHHVVGAATDKVHLSCTKLRGIPAPQFTWYQASSSMCKGQRDVHCKPQNNQWKKISSPIMQSEVLISPPRNDTVFYKCTAANIVGQDSKVFSVVRMDIKPPKITKFKNQVKVNGSDQLEIACHVEGVPIPDVIWIRKNQTVAECTGDALGVSKTCKASLNQNAARFNIKWLGTLSKLKVHSASHMSDGGILRCVARSQIGKAEAHIDVIVQESPKLVNQGEIAQYHAAFGVHRKLVIDILSGNPPPHYQWFIQRTDHCRTSPGICKPHPRRWVPSGHDVAPPQGTRSRRSTISLPPTKQNFFYKVEAANEAGHDSQVFSVVRIWEQVPEVSTPRGNTIDEGDTLEIVCTGGLYDFEVLDIQRKDRHQLPLNRTKKETTIVGTDTKITLIVNSVAASDAGEYVCLGLNLNSTSSARVNINITATVPPVVSLSNQTIINTIGHVSLQCHVISGYPKPAITWYRNGKPLKLKPLGTEGNCSSFSNGFYHLHGFQSTNSDYLVVCDPKHKLNTGWYTCKAENIKGEYEVTKYLNVHEAPSVQFAPEGSTMSREYGQSVEVTCLANGNPKPTILWVKEKDDGETHPVKSKDVKGGKSLQIPSVDEEHYGLYTCRAMNAYGNATINLSLVNSAVLSRKHVPAPITHLIAAILVSAILLLLLVVVGCTLYRRKKMYGGFYLCTTPPLPDLIKSLDPTSPLIQQVHKLPYDPVWEYPRGNIVFRDVLGTGAFGKVYLGETEGFLIVDDTSSVSSRHRLAKRKDYRRGSATLAKVGTLRVAVKCLKENATESDHNDLLSELKILIHVGAHKNIVNLLGACTKGPLQDLWIIIEYCPHGDLLQYLKDKREIHTPTWEPPTEDPKTQFSLTELVSAAYQVARGMEFLTSRRCIHRDLAARNVLVGENYVMKVADFGLARDVYRNDEYVKHTPGLVPIKWMALESLVDKVYSQKSDVWSFGILMWEIFTLGGNPYPELHPSEIYEYLIDGKRMEIPDNCPPEMYSLMKRCWMHGPEDRPTFKELVLALDKDIECNIPSMGREAYLELDNVEDENYNKADTDGYLQPSDIVITPKTSNHTEPKENNPPHDYTEILDVGPIRNGDIKDLNATEEKEPLLIKNPSEYEMAFKDRPRYVNMSDSDNQTTKL